MADGSCIFPHSAMILYWVEDSDGEVAESFRSKAGSVIRLGNSSIAKHDNQATLRGWYRYLWVSVLLIGAFGISLARQRLQPRFSAWRARAVMRRRNDLVRGWISLSSLSNQPHSQCGAYCDERCALACPKCGVSMDENVDILRALKRREFLPQGGDGLPRDTGRLLLRNDRRIVLDCRTHVGRILRILADERQVSCFGDQACSLVSVDWRNITSLAILLQYPLATWSALKFVSD